MSPEPQHLPVSAGPVEPVPDDRRPARGPIAVLPEAEQTFVDAVRAGGGEVAELSEETRAIVWLFSRRSDELDGILKANPQVEWVQLPWAGVDAFAPVLSQYAGTSTPLWTSAKGSYSQPVAEHALTLTLALLRELRTKVETKSWLTAGTGTSLYGLEVLIVGAGGIALELLRLLEPFGVRVTIVRRSSEPVEGVGRTVTADRLDEVLPSADVVILAAALTGGTSKLIGAPQLAAMKQTAVLVNIARGGLVDTDALTSALAAGAIAGAGLDVTDPEPLPDGHPLWSEPRAIVTSHTADTLEMITPLLADRVRRNVEAYLGDGRFVGVVDIDLGY